MILGQQPLTLRRFSGSRGADGRWTSTYTDSTIYGSWQPTNGRDLQRLSEGERSRGTRKVFTATALIVADAAGSVLADRIINGTEVYEVSTVQDWPTFGPLPHYDALLVRVAEPGGSV